MFEVEGLWAVSFGGPFALGIVVLYSERFLGGDSLYYYVGDYRLHERTIVANVRVTSHATPTNALADFAQQFDATIEGIIGDGVIDARLTRLGLPGASTTISMRFLAPLRP